MTGDEGELRLAWHRHVGTGSIADGWFDRVIASHRTLNRHYHGVRHVRWVIHHGRDLADGIDELLGAGDVDEIVAAGFFHDVVYDATRADNEAASAARARVALHEIGWQSAPIDRVGSMIEATAGHDASGAIDDPATAVLLAADLGVLAAEPGRYGDYTRAVRREYAHLDDRAWRQGRSAFIHGMLARDHIFPAGLHLEAWERRARANLTAELAALG